MDLFSGTGMKLKSSIIFCLLLLGVIGMTLATDDSKVLMLDTRNLEGADNYWGNGKDYSVTLAHTFLEYGKMVKSSEEDLH